MNGYKMLSDTYRQAGDEKMCKVYDFLATCDEDDFCTLFDSGAFNSIAKSYVHCTVSQLKQNGILNAKQAESVRDQFSELFEGFYGGAKDIHERY